MQKGNRCRSNCLLRSVSKLSNHRKASAATPQATSPSRQSWRPERQSTSHFSLRKAKRSRSTHAQALTWGVRNAVVSGEHKLPACSFRQPAGNMHTKIVPDLRGASRQAAEMNRLAACPPWKLQISLFQIHRNLRNLRQLGCNEAKIDKQSRRAQVRTCPESRPKCCKRQIEKLRRRNPAAYCADALGEICVCVFPAADLRDPDSDIFHCLRPRDSHSTAVGG